MDDYLYCLYEYVTEHLLARSRPDKLEHDFYSINQSRACDNLRKTLTPEQLQLLEDYQAARAKVWALEDEWLFQEAVALGKRMAQS